jgi:ribosomal protein S4E
MITFNEDTELEIVESFDETHDVIIEQGTALFRAGELVDADIISESETRNYVDLEFGNGNVALTVLRSSFTVLSDEDVQELRRRDEKRGLYGDKVDAAN